MRHTKLPVHRLHIDGVELGLRLGTLVAIEREVTDQIEWEIVAEGMEEYAGELTRCHVEVLCITGTDPAGHLVLSELAGDAIVVRFTRRTVVLRGDGPLSGLSQHMFT